MERKDTRRFVSQQEAPPKPSLSPEAYQLQGRLLKGLRQASLDYKMLENGDHVMVCVSGGKDSATLLELLTQLVLRARLDVKLTAVHVDQKQPGYDGRPLVEWLEHSYKQQYGFVDYRIIEEDTYSVVVNKTAVGKSYCTLCSRLRRGILYSTAMELGCNKIALGHHADDCLETLMLNMIHNGKMGGMPARYTSQRGSLGVIRPLMYCFEDDIRQYAEAAAFPILPCNLCSNQANLQRPQVKLLLQSLGALSPTAKLNMIKACQNVRPELLLDQSLREHCGMNAVTGEVEDDDELGL